MCNLSRSTGSRFVGQTFQSRRPKTLAPLAYGLVSDMQVSCHLPVFPPLRTAQHDTRTQCQALCSFRAACPFLQLRSFLFAQHYWLRRSAHAGWILSIANPFLFLCRSLTQDTRLSTMSPRGVSATIATWSTVAPSLSNDRIKSVSPAPLFKDQFPDTLPMRSTT